MNIPLLSIKGLRREFPMPQSLLSKIKGEAPLSVKAVDGVDIDIPRGKTFGLVGESGCGKSTIARLAVGLMRPTAGSVVYETVDINDAIDHEIRHLRRRMQMVFQDPYSSMNARWTIREIIAEPILTLSSPKTAAEVDHQVDELLRLVGLAPADKAKYAHEFSGGQRQRIAIARALSTKPEFLVCDEPTSALDVSVQSQILNLMRDLQDERGLTYLFISHNLSVISFMSDYVGVMYLGRMVEVGPTAEVFRTPRHPYTKLLIDTVPRLDRIGFKRKPMSGEVPNPIKPPSGCTFHPRCPMASTLCRQTSPALLQVADETRVACHHSDALIAAAAKG